MGTVAATYSLMPEDTAFDFQALVAQLPTVVPANVKVAKADIVPMAFGLKKLEVAFVMEDAPGLVDKLEETLRGLPGIQNVETEQVSLL
ncbi:MAG: elongation factor 1-beta [Euryarchaeota archaeon]|nr:elongation factor 1-beta [Euryarchaeota archaeon]